MKFKNGRGLSKGAKDALRFIVKTGVLTRRTWYSHFAHGNLRWRQAELKHLVDSKVLRPYLCQFIPDVFVLGSYGKSLIQEKGWKHVPFVPAHQITHNEFVGLGLMELEQAAICQKWMTAGELKANQLAELGLRIGKREIKFPDAVIQMNGNVVALEYEPENRTYWNYLPLLHAYQAKTAFHFIYFVVTTKETSRSIERALLRIGDIDLNGRVQICEANAWRSIFHESYQSSA